jgi:histidine ammonia-lyase
MKMRYTIDNRHINLHSLESMLKQNAIVELSESAKQKIQDCRIYLDEVVKKSDKLIYGINTGFGSLCNTAISSNQLEDLQRNLVLSHACGVGERVPDFIVRRMLLLKVIGLSHGHSGVQLETVERLLFLFNNHIYPHVFQLGSLGASGDLAPLAHLVLPLLGEGRVTFEGKEYSSNEINERFNLQPIRLRSKEGLALLNGTQFMSAYASYAAHEGLELWNKFNSVGALMFEAMDGRLEPFGKEVNEIRKQAGQIQTAAFFRDVLKGSKISSQQKTQVQDPYSLRCIPQVHGASKDTIDFFRSVVEREINAVTDNPTIFPEEDLVVSAGNFHGQPLALAMDYLAIALAELGSISERRTYKSIGGTRNLPLFLTNNPGLNSGFMISQYACASVVSQNKQLCTPASVDTIDSSNGQEDHVSMGANAGTKLFRVIENCYTVLGIEMLHACQAMEFRRPKKSSIQLETIHSHFRSYVDFVENDVYMHDYIAKSITFVKNNLIKNHE